SPPFPTRLLQRRHPRGPGAQIRRLAAEHDIKLQGIRTSVVNHYWLTGSFVHGTGEGHAEIPDIDIQIDSPANSADVETLARKAMDASPAVAFLRAAMNRNTFALYIA